MPERCPVCNSPDPKLHPAVQHEGEVSICSAKFHSPRKWNTGKPPNEKLVEVDLDGKIIRVKAFFGRDGYLPHWRSEDETKMWHPSTFSEWREIE